MKFHYKSPKISYFIFQVYVKQKEILFQSISSLGIKKPLTYNIVLYTILKALIFVLVLFWTDASY